MPVSSHGKDRRKNQGILVPHQKSYLIANELESCFVWLRPLPVDCFRFINDVQYQPHSWPKKVSCFLCISHIFLVCLHYLECMVSFRKCDCNFSLSSGMLTPLHHLLLRPRTSCIYRKFHWTTNWIAVSWACFALHQLLINFRHGKKENLSNFGLLLSVRLNILSLPHQLWKMSAHHAHAYRRIQKGANIGTRNQLYLV